MLNLIKKEKIIIYILFLTSIITPILSVLNMYFKNISYYKALGLVIFGFILLGIFFLNLNKVNLKIEHYLIFILIFFAIISTIFSVNKTKSIFGEEFSYEGLFVIISYYGLFLSASCVKSEDEIEKILNVILIIVLIQCIYGLGQKYNFAYFINNLSVQRPYGFCENPNMFGTLLVIGSGIIIPKFVFERNIRNSILYLICILVMFLLSVYCATRSAWLGIIFIYFLLTIIEKVRFIIFKRELVLFLHSISKIIIAFALCMLIYNCVDRVEKNYYQKRFDKVIQDVNIYKQTGEISDNAGSNRVKIWKYSYSQLLKKYWIFGCGIDCLKEKFKAIMPLKSNSRTYYKAHNEVLQIALTQGVFAASTFVLLLFVIIYRGFYNIIKTKVNYIYVTLFISFLAYLIQAFFNISVIEVAPYFWIICGFLCNNSV